MPASSVDRTPPAAPSDEALLKRLRSGVPAAGDELIGRYYRPLMQYLRRLVSDEQLAEELHQQTWLSALEHVDRFDPNGGGFKAWLFRIATNKANDHWRSRGREKAAHEGMRLVREFAGPSADAAPQLAEECEKLQRAIDLLPEPQKQVLLLRYYGSLKFTEIAELLGCPLNTALGRMHKAMLKLKALLDPEEGERDWSSPGGPARELP